MKSRKAFGGFTLVETLVAVSIFAVVSMATALLYTQSFRIMKQSNAQDQIYEDARFVLDRIADLVRNNMVDYDEYYNQNVIIGGNAAQPTGSTPFGLPNFGQNYGRYFSSFFNPGIDAALGYDCNDADNAGTAFIAPDANRSKKRNLRDCTILGGTKDKFTGANPYDGKHNAPATSADENAFCATVTYQFNQKNNVGESPDGSEMCLQNVGSKDPDTAANEKQPELYLISADGRYKTILAREKISQAPDPDMYALSILKMEGFDTNKDDLYDSFICAIGYKCTGKDSVQGVPLPPNVKDCENKETPQELPPDRAISLDHTDDKCDNINNAFSNDFVPITPFRITVQDIAFFISPLEDPHYAFAEGGAQTQPRVTIMITIAPNPAYVSGVESFSPITLVETVPIGVRNAIPAPELTL